MVHQIYFFFGFDSKSIKENISSLEEKILEKENITDQLTFFLSETPWNTILIDIYTESFFSGKKLIKIYETNLIDKKVLSDFLNQKLSNVIIVFIAYGDKIEDHFSPKLLKHIQNKGFLYISKKKYLNQLINKLDMHLKSNQYIYSEKVLHYICQQLNGLEDTIPKIVQDLKSYYSKGSTLKFEDISYLIRSENIPSIFEFIDSFFSKNWIESLNYLFFYDENYSNMLFLLFRQIELIYSIQCQLTDGNSTRTIFENLKIHPFIGEKIMKQAKNWNLEELEKIYTRLSLLHKALKKNDLQFHKDLIQIYLFSSISVE